MSIATAAPNADVTLTLHETEGAALTAFLGEHEHVMPLPLTRVLTALRQHTGSDGVAIDLSVTGADLLSTFLERRQQYIPASLRSVMATLRQRTDAALYSALFAAGINGSRGALLAA